LKDRARDKTTNEVVALKKVRMENEVHGVPLSSLREIIILKSLRHENIVQVKQVAVGTSLANIFMVMEYVEQDLAQLMESQQVKPFKKSEVKCLLSQLLHGVAYLHSRHIIHRLLYLTKET
jgi:serine/threonine protein kinase